MAAKRHPLPIETRAEVIELSMAGKLSMEGPTWRRRKPPLKISSKKLVLR